MKNKILSSVLAFAILMSFTTFSALAEQDGDDETSYELLYENTFDNGATGGVSSFNKETEHFILMVAQVVG